MTISLKADASGNFGSILINGTEAVRVNPGGIPASSTAFTPSGNIAASNVQAAIQELDTETQAGLATKLSLSGGTMTGSIRMQKAANQSYFMEFCAASTDQRSAAIVGEYQAGVWEGLLLLAGNNAASYKFYATGTAYAPVGWQPTSDARVKSEITPMVDALQRLNQIDGCTYKRLDVGDPDRVYGGFIAQNVRESLPEGVEAAMTPTEKQVELGIDKDDRILSIDTTAILALAVQSIKELSTKLDAAVAEIAALKAAK